jgi:5-hydroxyisourate hydrolase-like protein (transthyretin family)
MARSFACRLLTITAVLLASASLSVVPVAAQEQVGYISGTITAQATGEPVTTACVEAYVSPTEAVSSACTGATGTYTMSVPVGTYRVRVHDVYGTFQRYATRWAYAADSYETADPITVVSDRDAVVDVALLPAGAIAGTVTDAVTGEPPPSACVEIMPVGSDLTVAYTCTDYLGHYRAVLTDPGDYNVRFSADYYVPEWAIDKATRAEADAITVSAAVDTQLDAQLTPLGRITGRVTDLTGTPLEYISVWANGFEEPFGFGYAETDVDGRYEVRGLPAGRYHVQFGDGFGNWVPEWWNNSPDQAHADPVSVSLAAETGNINAALGQSGYITGTVTDAATGQPLGNVCARAVLATSRLGEVVSESCTDGDGHYRINAVGGSTYKVYFSSFDPAYLIQWYRNKATLKSANRIRVEYGQTVANIDAAMVRAS